MQLRSLLKRLASRHETPELPPPPKLSVEEQFAILGSELRNSSNRGPLGELVIKHFDGHVAQVGRLFTLTRAQYLAWARTLPDDAFVASELSLRDDFYLIQEESQWTLLAQERGMENWKMRFDTKEQALEHAYQRLSPYGVFEYLTPSSVA